MVTITSLVSCDIRAWSDSSINSDIAVVIIRPSLVPWYRCSHHTSIIGVVRFQFQVKLQSLYSTSISLQLSSYRCLNIAIVMWLWIKPSLQLSYSASLMPCHGRIHQWSCRCGHHPVHQWCRDNDVPLSCNLRSSCCHYSVCCISIIAFAILQCIHGALTSLLTSNQTVVILQCIDVIAVATQCVVDVMSSLLVAMTSWAVFILQWCYAIRASQCLLNTEHHRC